MCPNDYLILVLCCIIVFLIIFPNILDSLRGEKNSTAKDEPMSTKIITE